MKGKLMRCALTVMCVSLIAAVPLASGADAKTKASPIKIGSLWNETGFLTFPQITAALQASVNAVNAEGGIHGRPLALTICDEANSPSESIACAHKLVSNHVVADISSSDYLTEHQTGQIFEAAGVPQIGDQPEAEGWSSQPNTFLLFETEGALAGPAADKYCASKGLRKLAIPTYGVPAGEALAAATAAAAPKVGDNVVSQPAVATTTTDYAPLAQTLQASGAQCVYAVLPPAAVAALIAAGKSLNYSPTYIIQPGSFASDADYKALPAGAKIVVLSQYPLPTDTAQFPVFKEFQQAMKAGASLGTPVNDTNTSTGSINAWFTVQALKEVLEGINGPITPASVMSALKKAKDVNLGLPQSWSPNLPGPAAFKRVWTGVFYAHPFANGVQTEGGAAFNVLSLVKGK